MKGLALLPLIIASLCAAATGAEDPAAFAPKDTLAYLSVRDARTQLEPLLQAVAMLDERPADVARGFLRSLGPAMTGRLSLALLKSNPPGRMPTALLRIEVDPEKADIAKVIAGMLKAEVQTDGKLRSVETGRRGPEVVWATHEGSFYVSNVRKQVERAIKPDDDRVAGLPKNERYRALGEHVDWDADIVAFADLERLLWERQREQFAAGEIMQTALGRWLYPFMAAYQFRTLGLSISTDGGPGSVHLAVRTPENRAGLADLFDAPNGPPPHLDRLPANCMVLYGQSIPPLTDLIANSMAELDPKVAKEFRADLAAWSEDLGVDLEADLLNAFGQVAIGGGMSPRTGAVLYGVTSVRDPDAFRECAAALAKYNKTPLKTERRGDRTFYVLSSEPAFHYTFDGRDVLFSNSIDSIETMLHLEPANSLAQSKAFARLREKLPGRAAVFCAVNARWAAGMARMGFARDPALREFQSEGMDKLFASFARGEPGLSFGLAVRSEPKAYTLHIESLSGDLWKLLPVLGVLSFAPAKKSAEMEAQKTYSKMNLRSIAAATEKWKEGYGGKEKKYPRSMTALLAEDQLLPRVFLRPGSGTEPVEGKFVSDYASVLDRCPYQLKAEQVVESLWMLAWEKRPYQGRRCVVYFDQHVDEMSEEEFQKELKELDRWIEENKPEKE